eukprot:gb/GECG01005325.1/.p1 GENE.gb/GECG01005325.1/~~gb/GECG01005325.1/.p1  ORF type:complete len:104 (+),score=21.83 gb/GECG01005325.1/:1-312(+)
MIHMISFTPCGVVQIEEASVEYNEVYLPELQSKVEERKKKAESDKQNNLQRIRKDLGISSKEGQSGASASGSTDQRQKHAGYKLGGSDELPLGVSSVRPVEED